MTSSDSQLGRPLGSTDSLMPEPARLGLLTDLYELTMAAAYWSTGLADHRATFDLYFRQFPPHRNYMIAAGLEQAIDYLVNLRFTEPDIAHLQSLPVFRHVSAGWFDALRKFRFTGDLWAVPEGTAVFAGEPMLRVTGPIMESQIVETFLINAVAYQSSVATKAARIVTAAQGRTAVDFGTRRAHGPQAGLLAARASFIGGFTATSNVLAAQRLGIPAVGTMAHSWVMAIQDEPKAFQQFVSVFPEHTTLLIDTYNTLEGARNAVRAGARPTAIRLDSGDLDSLSRQARRLLEEAGWSDVSIFASGDLNETKIAQLVATQSPIDAFGVGTELATVADAPSLGIVYKLAEVAGLGGESGRIKLSAGKRTYPGAKQLFRQSDANGRFCRDIVGLESEQLPGDRLLAPIILAGKPTQPIPPLTRIQMNCREQLALLPKELLSLEAHTTYPVEISEKLQTEFDRISGDRRN